ncbi:sulfite exporter TauE/SafE family protein [Aquabacterium sp.]|uniref:sulfite exporter TauE/SafE family protein n=1 Tax=Aquabacterium sp. TaxID=1872578 RepID=UPI00403845B1
MLDLNALNVSLMLLASAAAGLVDAIVGGGGLIIVPSLFGLFPQAVPATLLGTNKAASIWGTGWAAWQYAKQVTLPSSRLMGAIIAAMLGGLIGAWLATLVPASRFRAALPIVLAAVWLYTLWRKDMGRHHAPHWSHQTETLLATGIGAAIGFYDGIFGPGTGSFFVFALVRLLGWDFLHASAGAKRLNFATNVAALAWFIPHGHVEWALSLPMAVANVAGSTVGTRLALRHGAGFVRVAFLIVVGALILKTGWDAWLR